MFATHGYVNPTLVDGLTKPHNPGLEYDVFAYWNQRRLDENQDALARIGQGITRPVNGPIVRTVPDKQNPDHGRDVLRDDRDADDERRARPDGREDDHRQRGGRSRLQRHVHGGERTDDDHA